MENTPHEMKEISKRPRHLARLWFAAAVLGGCSPAPRTHWSTLPGDGPDMTEAAWEEKCLEMEKLNSEPDRSGITKP